MRDISGEIAVLNGEFMPLDQACVSVNDRGFLFGDSVYEVVRAYSGRAWALDRHLTRLSHSLQGVEIIKIDLAYLRGQILEALHRSGILEAVIYLQITRGVAPRAHLPNGVLEPTVLITVRPVEELPEEGWRSGVSAILVPECRWMRRDIKSTNLLPNVLAKREARARNAAEAIFITEEGWINEGSTTNIFIVNSGSLRTPPNGPNLLPGITRDLVVELAHREGLDVEEAPVSQKMLMDTEEVFLTGTISEIMGVVRIDEQGIGDGMVGATTRRLHDAYHARIAAQDDAP